MGEITKFNHMLANLKHTPWINALKVNKGKAYLVGGIVRDFFIGRDSKDIDLLVSGIPMDLLIKTLGDYGKVDVVGESFGVIKFKPHDSFPGSEDFEETIDIALPRTEKKVGEGHKGFEIVSDHQLPIEVDLARRDYTMNAIAVDMEGNIIDPFGGVKDIESKCMKMVSAESFIEDPLRMLRGVQFGARFGFHIEANTQTAIVMNASKIKELAVERVTDELRKMCKGDAKLGIDLLIATTLITPITEIANSYIQAIDEFDHTCCGDITGLAQLIFVIFTAPNKHYVQEISTSLKLSVNERKELLAYAIAGGYHWHGLVTHWNVWDAGRIWAGIYTTDFINIDQDTVLTIPEENSKSNTVGWSCLRANLSRKLFTLGVLPKNLNELAINAFELQQLGYEGAGIGVAFARIVNQLMRRKIENDKREILEFLNKPIEQDDNDE